MLPPLFCFNQQKLQYFTNMDPIQSAVGIVQTAQMAFLTKNIRPKSLAGGTAATSILTLCKVPKGKILLAEVTVFALDATSGDRAAYHFIATVANKAGTVALVGTVTALHTAEDDNTWVVTAVANNTSKTLDLQVTPDGTNATKFWGYAKIIG